MARAPRHLSSPPSPTVPSSRIPSTAHQATRLLSLLLLRQPPLSLSPPSTSRGTLSLPLSLPSSLLVLVLYLYLFPFTKRFVRPFSAYYSITFLSLLAERVVALFFHSALFSLILFVIISAFFQLLYYSFFIVLHGYKIDFIVIVTFDSYKYRMTLKIVYIKN